MSAIGGSIESISVDGRIFAVAADADATIKLGGKENEIQPNGNATARKIQTRVAWSVTGLSVSIDDSLGDLEYLQAIADGEGNVPIAITMASGTTYSGTGTIVGELAQSSQNATAAVDFSGPGNLEAQG